jgi:hypothetical protein
MAGFSKEKAPKKIKKNEPHPVVGDGLFVNKPDKHGYNLGKTEGFSSSGCYKSATKALQGATACLDH